MKPIRKTPDFTERDRQIRERRDTLKRGPKLTP